LYLKDSITLGEGSGNTFIMLLKGRRKGDCGNAENPRKDSGTSEETIPEGQAGERVPILSSL
jgi:hypothetical protein